MKEENNIKTLKTRKSTSSKDSGSRKESLNETITDLENHPEKIKDKFKDLIEEGNERKNDNYKKEIENHNQSKGRFSITRFIFVLIFGSLSFINSMFKIYIPSYHPTKITDYSHFHTEKYYLFLKENEDLRVILTTTTAIIQDLTLFTLIYYWVMKGTSWRPVISFFCFFLFKILNTLVFSFQPIQDALFDLPEIFSFTYPTKKDYNFFFTGMIGFNLLSFLFLYNYHSHFAKIISLLSLLNCIFQFFFFMFTRSTYIIDIGTSAFIAHYCYSISEYLEKYFDELYSLKEEGIEKEKEILENEESLKSEIESETHTKIGQDEIYLKRKHDVSISSSSEQGKKKKKK